MAQAATLGTCYAVVICYVIPLQFKKNRSASDRRPRQSQIHKHVFTYGMGSRLQTKRQAREATKD